MPGVLMPADGLAGEFVGTKGETYQRPVISRGRPTSRFDQLGRIGEGRFGDVYIGADRSTGKVVAIKEVRLPNLERNGLPKAALRELRALQHLEGHQHVVRLLDAFPRGGSLALVLEYMPSDLEVMFRTRRSVFPESQIKSYMWMLLQGLSYLHARRILHRDLKPSNILLSARGVIKIGDLGSARVDNDPPLEPYSHQVGTAWYRAPELLLGARRYGPAIDMWGAGVIMGEMACLSPLFPGRGDLDQIFRVLEVLGTPSASEIEQFPDYRKIEPPCMAKKDLSQVFPRVPPAGMCLFEQLVELDPTKRVSAETALTNRFFYIEPAIEHPGNFAVVTRKLPLSVTSILGSRFENCWKERKGDNVFEDVMKSCRLGRE
ncbi:cell cycle related kinase [Nannochloropsis gaditana]|uniref:Cyclin-dependent kinase 2 homolog n=1 Tax=Nannochloropsis gaditana TaxID=72520 RepID=W7TYJ0_9STRA|nr:cell cycle related kinase [Nannochloropsis gaditana]